MCPLAINAIASSPSYDPQYDHNKFKVAWIA